MRPVSYYGSTSCTPCASYVASPAKLMGLAGNYERADTVNGIGDVIGRGVGMVGGVAKGLLPTILTGGTQIGLAFLGNLLIGGGQRPAQQATTTQQSGFSQAVGQTQSQISSDREKTLTMVLGVGALAIAAAIIFSRRRR